MQFSGIPGENVDEIDLFFLGSLKWYAVNIPYQIVCTKNDWAGPKQGSKGN